MIMSPHEFDQLNGSAEDQRYDPALGMSPRAAQVQSQRRLHELIGAQLKQAKRKAPSRRTRAARCRAPRRAAVKTSRAQSGGTASAGDGDPGGDPDGRIGNAAPTRAELALVDDLAVLAADLFLRGIKPGTDR